MNDYAKAIHISAQRALHELASLLDAIARTSTDEASRDLAGIGVRLANEAAETISSMATTSEGRAKA